MSERSPRRRAPMTGGRRSKPPHPSPSPRQRSLKILKRCSSAPLLLDRAGDDDNDVDCHHVRSGGTLFRPQTFSDAFLSSPQHGHSSQIQGYDKEAKVVVNVTVEGSPGPVRTMVKLGSSVEETVKRVVDRYREEGRSPKLDPSLASSFQLHHSHFCLQSLDKSQVIGDAGSRSFYLRKSPSLLLSSFIARKIDKIVRRAHRLWRIVICLQ